VRDCGQESRIVEQRRVVERREDSYQMVVEDQSALRPGPVVVNLATGRKQEIPAAVSGARSPLFERSKSRPIGYAT